MYDLDLYRSMSTGTLLLTARELGIDPYMAVAIAERLEALENLHYEPENYAAGAKGGRYAFNHRSI